MTQHDMNSLLGFEQKVLTTLGTVKITDNKYRTKINIMTLKIKLTGT